MVVEHERKKPGKLHAELGPKPKSIKKFAEDESGSTAIEYGLIASGIVLVLIPLIYQLGADISDAFYEGMTEAFGGGGGEGEEQE